MKPHVVYHVAASVDGLIDGFEPDVGLFYRLAGRWREDVTLTGADTMLAAEPALAEEPATEEDPALAEESAAEEKPAAEGGPVAPGEAAAAAEPAEAADTRALLAVVDSRGRLRDWARLGAWPYWRGAVALCSATTPAEHLSRLAASGVETIVAGEARVDLAAALGELGSRYGARTVRVDSGGSLAGALLRAGLVDEVSVLVHPVLVGDLSGRSIFRLPDREGAQAAVGLALAGVEQVEGGVLWVRYEVRP
jgi:2,5-diamino-6-(ribosylamino)-4(3H)-pyrimidinone 5'-phosphate reductase